MKLANSALRRDCDTTVQDFKWNSIHISIVDGIRSLSEVCFIGLTVNVLVGGNGSGTVSAKGTTQPIMLETADKEAIVRDGGNNCIWLVLFANDRALQQFDEFDTHELGALGFWTDCVRVRSRGRLEKSGASSQISCIVVANRARYC